MKRVYLFFTVCTISFNAYTQSTSKTFEQKAFEYFISNIRPIDYNNVHFIYFKSKVNQNLSQTMRPVGFKDYERDFDSSEIKAMKERRLEIMKNNSEDSFVHLPAIIPNNLKIAPLPKKPKKTKKKNLSTTIFVGVYKRTTIYPNSFVVEIRAANKDLQNFYFIEINKYDQNLIRWYKTTYQF